ncbi:MAG: alpha/beta hydrolase [Xanthobacteraceae bacterium]|jgi:pimeloyl-ACP methyl ester carboxylesterase
MFASGAPDTGRSIFVTAQDGLRLHVREYGTRTAPALAVVCLPALTRTVADFEVLAPALANDGARRVIAIDSRGRGRSDYDRNPQNYNLLVELADVVAVLTALAVGPAVFIGSSRGGLLAMQLGVAHPTVIGGIVLHDIGPVIEPKGLARIKSYAGKLPQPRSFEEGAEILRRLFNHHFPQLTAEQWLAAAQRAWQMRDGALKPTYDVRLARTLAGIDIERPLPPLWNQFDALSRVPMLVIRGEKSDILSAATVAAMAARHPGMESIEVADQGHVPLLEGDIIHRVVEFVAKCDGAARRPETEPDSAGAVESRPIASKRWGDSWQ